jgi:YNFM family putative membrane transporter
LAVPVGGLLAGAVLVLLAIQTTEAAWVVTMCALAMAVVGATEGPYWATSLEVGGKQGATSAGIMNTGGNAGGMLAPLLTPVISSYLDWKWGIGMASIVCLIGVGFWLCIDPAKSNSSHEGGWKKPAHSPP